MTDVALIATLLIIIVGTMLHAVHEEWWSAVGLLFLSLVVYIEFIGYTEYFGRRADTAEIPSGNISQ